MDQGNIFLYLVGTAGSGKSSLTSGFQQWMALRGLDVATVNLDPGAEKLEYSPDVDIREWISLPRVMEENDLGPNGAQIAAADMLAFKAGELAGILEDFETNYFLVDTPGQLELFSFRKSSDLILNALGEGRSAIAFTVDPLVSRAPGGFLTQMMLLATVKFRFQVPTFGVLTKADLLEDDEVDRIRSWATDPEALNNALMDRGTEGSTVINMELLKALESVGAMEALVDVSSHEMYGLEDLYNLVQQVFMGGEDLMPD